MVLHVSVWSLHLPSMHTPSVLPVVLSSHPRMTARQSVSFVHASFAFPHALAPPLEDDDDELLELVAPLEELEELEEPPLLPHVFAAAHDDALFTQAFRSADQPEHACAQPEGACPLQTS